MIRRGFTFIELTVAIAVIATLTSLATINLLAVQNRASISSAANTLVADLRAQQIKAISGDTEGSGVVSSHGIYFSGNSYTLYRGDGYSVDNPTNFSVPLVDPLTLSSDFPNATVIFAPGSGEITGYDSSQDTIIITNPTTTETSIIELNRYGVVTQSF